MTKQVEWTARPGSVFLDVPQPGLQPPPDTDSPDSGHNRRGAYAAMKDLAQQFSDAGIGTEQVWEHIKAEHGVDSRAKLTAPQWALIAARLQSARRDPEMFTIFVDMIPDCYFRIHAYSSDPRVPIGRPRDIEKHHIASEWGDFQELANANGCEITVTQGKRTTYYSPSESITPFPLEMEPEPVLELKPDVSLETNVRGEVLNVFGDVVEIREVAVC